jgi:hypothetical protein
MNGALEYANSASKAPRLEAFASLARWSGRDLAEVLEAARDGKLGEFIIETRGRKFDPVVAKIDALYRRKVLAIRQEGVS